MKIQNVKGCYDYSPQEQNIKNHITETLKETFQNYGYQSIETPILCHYDMLSDKYDEDNDLLKEIYRLKDQGNRDLGLRYDLTVPFAKYIALNKKHLQFPFKRYEINKVFRNGPLKIGRDREFTQCDVDVVGLDDQLIEAELLNLYQDAFEKLEIPIIIKYNSRNLLRGLIIQNNIKEEQIDKVTTIIDKIDKVSKEQFKEMLLTQNIVKEDVENLIIDLNEILENLINKYPNPNLNLQKGLEELTNLNEYIINTPLEKICKFTPSLARGQNYYTGNVFEVYDANQTIKSSIGGGGRYDNMITNFIEDKTIYPAVGISFGVSVIYEILKEKQEQVNNTKVLIIPINTTKQSLQLATILRKHFKVELELKDKKLKKSLDYANKQNIPYVIIYGEEEIKNNQINLKNMQTSETYIINTKEELINIIKG